MREQMKQQIRDMLITLGKAEAILDSKIKKKDTEDLGQLFEDMQNSAITIGTTIEQVEGDGTETVKLLEEYCELLWQYMTEEVLKERFHMARLLAGKRGEVCASLESEFEARLEILFLVCREQGWKQMERFYHIMEEKADCYVLTAPYVESVVQGDGAVIHDESGIIPDSVRSGKFEAYDIQMRKPDLVFVDGPYGEAGETGFTPDYDFMEIRENAGMVLYVPCYSDVSQAEETHCRIPQVRYSDIILVPSKEVSEFYVKAMSRLDHGRDLIRKLYVMDTLDEEKLLTQGKLSRMLEKQK